MNIFKNSKKQEVVTLKDVRKIIIAWRKSCEERGQVPAGVYNLASTSPGGKKAYESLQWVFGEEGTAMLLHRINTEELLKAITKNSGGKKMHKGEAVVFHF